jgi:hypothetical protein
MKHIVEIKRGQPVPEDSKLLAYDYMVKREAQPQGGFKDIIYDLYEVSIK